MEKYSVIFRKDAENGEIIAFFPESHSTGKILCYAHIGQHCEASMSYYWTTKKASPEEYAGLLAELRGIYEHGEDAMQLVVKQRMSYKR